MICSQRLALQALGRTASAHSGRKKLHGCGCVRGCHCVQVFGDFVSRILLEDFCVSVHCACVFPSSLRTMGEPHSLSKSCLTVGWFFQRRSVLFGWKKFFPRNIFWLVKMCVCVFFPPGAFFWLVNVEKL